MVRRAMRLLLGIVPLIALPALAGGCGSPASPSDSAPYSQVDLVIGTGATAATGNVLTVNYNGWFYDGSATDHKGLLFTTSVNGGPVVFTAGANGVIAGWEQGVLGMQEGGLRRLVIPPSLAYGPNRYSAIPPNATLLFELELVKVE